MFCERHEYSTVSDDRLNSTIDDIAQEPFVPTSSRACLRPRRSLPSAARPAVSNSPVPTPRGQLDTDAPSSALGVVVAIMPTPGTDATDPPLEQRRFCAESGQGVGAA